MQRMIVVGIILGAAIYFIFSILKIFKSDDTCQCGKKKKCSYES